MQTGKLAIGCSIHGVDAKSLAPGQMLKIKDLLYKNRLIVLKDQSLTEQEYCDFAHRVGSPVPYLQDNYHHPEFPLIFVSSNVKSDRQADRRRPHRRLLALRHLLRDRPQVHHHADAEGPAADRRPQHPLHRHGRGLCRAPAGDQGPPRRHPVPAHGRMRFKVRPDCIGLDIFEILSLIDQATPPVTPPRRDRAPLHQGEGDLRQPRLHHRHRQPLAR